MVFLRMALRNVARNWNRTGLIILSMAVASAMMTLTTAFSSGYAEGVDLAWRQMLGADILVYPDLYVFGASRVEADTWELRRLDPDRQTDALFFHPSLTEGYLRPTGTSPGFFDLEALPAALAETPGVDGVRPARLLPAYMVLTDPDGTERLFPVTLRGRAAGEDRLRWGMDGVVAGAYFEEQHDGQWLAVVNRHGLPPGSPPPGGRLELRVPVVRGYTSDGTPILDHTQTKAFYFLVYGSLELSLGDVRLEGAQEFAEYLGPDLRWPVYIDKPEVWVPSGTFDTIHLSVAGEPLRYVSQLGVTVRTMAEAKKVAADLAAALPGCTVLTVPQEVALSGIHYRARLVSSDPFAVEVTRHCLSRSTLPLDVRSGLSVLSFVVAGLLVAANMYILVSQRRREIGVLKAIGATGRDILVLFLTEALGYALVGSLTGFLSVRLLTLLSMFSSPASAVEGARLTLKAAGLIVGLTLSTAAVFGFLPAWEAARTPSATLLGDS